MKVKDLFNLEETVLTEMPQEIAGLDWHDLNTPTKNHELYVNFTETRYNKNKEVMKIWTHASLYTFKSMYFVLDHSIEQIVYYMQYKVDHNGILGQFLWQSLVWKDETVGYVDGLPQKIFFEYLLPKFGVIVTDSQQTWDGKRFWRTRIREALDTGLNVYYFNFQNRQLTKLHNIEEFRTIQVEEDVWGPSNLHQMKRIIISNKDLPISK